MARPQEFDTATALKGAMTLFWRQGYEATSLADLLAVTGLSKSSLYGAFGSKHSLLLAAFDAYRKERMREMETAMSRGSGRVGIEGFFRIAMDAARKPDATCGCMGINQAVEMAPHDPAVRERVEADFRLIETAFRRCVERGQGDGSISSSRPPEHLAKLLLTAFPGLQVLARAGADAGQLEDCLGAVLIALD